MELCRNLPATDRTQETGTEQVLLLLEGTNPVDTLSSDSWMSELLRESIPVVLSLSVGGTLLW